MKNKKSKMAHSDMTNKKNSKKNSKNTEKPTEARRLSDIEVEEEKLLGENSSSSVNDGSMRKIHTSKSEDIRQSDHKENKPIESVGTHEFLRNRSTRRSRTVMSAYQSKLLHDFFDRNPFPSTEMREDLSKSLGMKPRTIQIWFQNQRQKTKNRKESTIRWEFRDRGVEYRALNILATVSITMLYERKKELEKSQDCNQL